MSRENRGPPTEVEDTNLQSYVFTTFATIASSVDKKVCVQLRDNRTFIGILRTFDQFANLVLQDATERVYCPPCFGEKYRGVIIVRGENVAFVGEIDLEREGAELSALQQISYKEAEEKFAESQKAQEEIKAMKNRYKKSVGIVVDSKIPKATWGALLDTRRL